MNNVTIHFVAVFRHPETGELMDVDGTDKVLAIRAIRQMMGTGLRASKMIVEEYMTLLGNGLLEVRIECHDDTLMALMKHILCNRVDCRQFEIRKLTPYFNIDGCI